MSVVAEDRLGGLRVRRAVRSDLPAVAGLLTEAAAWARRRGIERWWPIPFPEEPVRQRIDRRETFVAERGGEIVATLALWWADPDRWGPQPPVAGYVHALAVARRFAHRGVGPYLLDWAADRVRRAGRTRLRLDCLATNASLIAHYESLGFRRVAVVLSPVPGEARETALLERTVGDAPHSPAARPGGRGPRAPRRAR